jgi:23S rRNA (pseudouridine1915-N3)-methyltransferase
MRLLIAAVGKLKQEPERELVAHYLGRAASAGRALGFAHFDAIEIPESKAATAALRAQAEAAVLLAKSTFAHDIVALDPRGDQLDSEAFASMLRRLRDDGKPGLTFVIGGADGLGNDLLAKAQRRLSLGAMTLPHGLARVVLAEQIYRAMTILAGHPYHRAGAAQG